MEYGSKYINNDIKTYMERDKEGKKGTHKDREKPRTEHINTAIAHSQKK